MEWNKNKLKQVLSFKFQEISGRFELEARAEQGIVDKLALTKYYNILYNMVSKLFNISSRIFAQRHNL